MNISFKTIILFSSAIATGVLVNSTSNAQTTLQAVPEIDWNTRLSSFELDPQDIGKVFTFNCPLASAIQVDAPIWGTDTYTVNSGLCTAAVHAGMITTDGGYINVELNPKASLYEASDRFGIASRSYEREIPSIKFIGDPIAVDTNQETEHQSSASTTRRRPSSIERTVGNGVRKGIERTISDSIRDIFR